MGLKRSRFPGLPSKRPLRAVTENDKAQSNYLQPSFD